MEKDNGIDKLFKDGLHDPEIPFNELDWVKMEQKLDAQSKKKVIPFWLFAASGIAATLVVGLFWYFADSNNTIKEDPKKVEIVNAKPVVNGTDTGSVVKAIPEPAERSVESTVETHFKNIDKNYAKTPKVIDNSQELVSAPDTTIAKEQKKQELIAQVVTPVATPKTEDKPLLAVIDSPLTDKPIEKSTDKKTEVLAQTNKPVVNSGLPDHTKLTLSIMAAPDISNVKLNVDTKISSNIGVLATYAITNKISVTTGAIYSRKLYNYGGIGSAGTAYLKNAWQVNANCIVLDVPLNVNYTFLKRRNYSIGINSGLSSYFMLSEKYKYITGPQGGTQKISELEIKNQNQHIFGVANLSLSFERRITNTLSFGVQPFVKLPLTGIGNGNARLKSTGVAFSLNLGLFPKSGGKK
ncbi:hypothetical protein [Pedobacter sp. B4-66]|uniref:hypothetical protein n=1 Tax=Pedobacter sp. B4-66 TaxID=2817280 RepID=UPI001BD92EF3|nr:hypothetical protein [Pedobacter sp. B4-66]